MKDAVPMIIVGLMFAFMGYWIGYNEASKKPTQDLVLAAISEEVASLQKDVIRWQHTAMILLVRMTFMEEWRGSILFRSLEPTLSDQDKELIMENFKKEKEKGVLMILFIIWALLYAFKIF